MYISVKIEVTTGFSKEIPLPLSQNLETSFKLI